MLKITKTKGSILSLLTLFFIVNEMIATGGGDVSSQACGTVVTGQNVNAKDNTVSCGITTGAKEQEGPLSEAIDFLNSVKDKVSWKIQRNTPKQDLGKITENKTVTVTYPAAGKMNMVSFYPTSGKGKNKKVELLFVSYDIYNQKNNIAFPEDDKAAKENLEKELRILKEAKSPYNYTVKIYRKIGNEKQYMEIAGLYSKESPDRSPLNTSWTIMPDGKVLPSEQLFITDADGITTKLNLEPIDLTAME